MARQPRRARKPIHDDFDGAWKNMLTERRFADFVAFFLPDIHAQIDWTKGVVFLEQELRAITRKTKRGQKAVDRLVQVWLKDGNERWVLIHAEIQSQADLNLPKRMFQYYFRAFDLFDGRPFTCLAILGDNAPDWKPHNFGADWWGTRVSFDFRAVKLLNYETRLAELETSANPFARFVLAHLKTVATQDNYESRLAWKLRIIQGLYDMGVPEAEIGQLYHDFDWLLALPETLAVRYHRTMVRFEEEREMPHMSTAERIGHRAGRIEEAIASITEILEMRFGVVSSEIVSRLAQITDLAQLRQLRRLAVNIASPADFAAELIRPDVPGR
jgi:hypothetical protein